MSFAGSSNGIHFSGLSSGLDTEAIINQLLSIEKAPITKLNIQKALLQNEQTALEQYKGQLTAFKSALDTLKSASAFQLTAASSSDASVASVSATSDAAAGLYALSVSKLAQAHKIRSNAQLDSTSQLGLTGTFDLNGKSITVIATDTLKTIATKINGSGAEVTASIIEGGSNNVYITLTANKTGAAHEIQRSDTSGTVLATLGLDSGNEVVAAQDAEFSIDGIDFTSATNSVSTIIPNVTFSLLKANETTPETTTITISRDLTAIRKNVDALAEAYNNLVSLVKAQGSFDSQTLATGPLFGETTVLDTQATLFNVLTSSPEGIQGDFKNLLAVGISFDSDGKMTVDDAQFETALAGDLSNVKALFQDMGSSDTEEVSFISAGARTKGSGLIGYAVEITQAATRGTVSAGTAMTSPSTSSEQLTFRGALIGSEDYVLDVAPGTTLNQLIQQINSDPKLKDLLTASNDGSDHLTLTSKRYGAAGSFSVTSDLAAGSDNSGIGTSPLDAEGLDVQGTINGEPATGAGQFLTGNSGNANTDGLQIKVTATSPGVVGTLVLTRGAASVLSSTLASTLDFTSGALAASTNAIDAKISDIDDRIEQINQSAADKEAYLRQKFAAMESAMTELQNQMSRLSSMLGTLNTSGSSG